MAYTQRIKEYIFLKGKLKWARTHAPDPTYNKWNVVIYPDAESLEKVRDLQARGIKNPLKKDEDGYYANFSRPAQKMIKGAVVGFTPPVVLSADGVTPFDGRIGNGSDGTVKIEVYGGTHAATGMKYLAARLESIRVDNLVPYEQESYTDEETKQTEGMAEQPKPQF